jgi:hypothetical protein
MVSRPRDFTLSLLAVAGDWAASAPTWKKAAEVRNAA